MADRDAMNVGGWLYFCPLISIKNFFDRKLSLIKISLSWTRWDFQALIALLLEITKFERIELNRFQICFFLIPLSTAAATLDVIRPRSGRVQIFLSADSHFDFVIWKTVCLCGIIEDYQAGSQWMPIFGNFLISSVLNLSIFINLLMKCLCKAELKVGKNNNSEDDYNVIPSVLWLEESTIESVGLWVVVT